MFHRGLNPKMPTFGSRPLPLTVKKVFCLISTRSPSQRLRRSVR
jgi:hypothetical protein